MLTSLWAARCPVPDGLTMWPLQLFCDIDFPAGVQDVPEMAPQPIGSEADTLRTMSKWEGM